MADIKQTIIDYLTEQLTINDKADKSMEEYNLPIQEQDPEIKKMREIEHIKLRDRSHELKRHIAVVKLLGGD